MVLLDILILLMFQDFGNESWTDWYTLKYIIMYYKQIFLKQLLYIQTDIMHPSNDICFRSCETLIWIWIAIHFWNNFTILTILSFNSLISHLVSLILFIWQVLFLFYFFIYLCHINSLCIYWPHYHSFISFFHLYNFKN